MFACQAASPTSVGFMPRTAEVWVEAVLAKNLLQRSRARAFKGIFVLWLLQWTPKLEVARYTPKAWEKWLHTADFGGCIIGRAVWR